MSNANKSLDEVNVLYKYRTFTNKFHLNTFLFGEFYFATRQELNDPYDLSFAPSFQHATKEQMLNHLDYLKEVGVREGYLTLYVQAQYVKNKKLIEKNPEEWHRRLIDAFNSKTDKVGVLSLSANSWDNILMWAHYSDNNSGFCIGLSFRRLREWLQKMKLDITPFLVEYISSYPPSSSLNPYTLDVELYKILFNHKYNIWGYENEVRFIMLGADNVGNRTIRVPLDITEEIYVGLNCSPTDLECVINALRISKSGTKLYRIIQHPNKFELDREEISY